MTGWAPTDYRVTEDVATAAARPGYPTDWDPSYRMRGGHDYAGVVLRLFGPREGQAQQAECTHRHRTPGEALSCAKMARAWLRGSQVWVADA